MCLPASRLPCRPPQIQASDTRLGMADLLPQFEQHLVRIAAQAVQPAAPAARLPPGLPLGAGAAGLAALQQLPRGWGSGSSSGASAASLLDQLLASDAGPPPAALSLADAPAALQAVAAHALQLAPVQPRPVAAAGGVLVPAGMPLPPAAMQAAAGVQPARPDSPGLLIWPMGTELSQHLPRLVGSPQQSSLQRLLGFE